MRIVAALLCAVLAAAGAPARADEAHDLAADIIGRTGSDASMEPVLGLLRRQVVATIVSRSGKTAADAGAVFDEVFLPALRGALPQMRAGLVDVYVRDYDLSDLRAIDGFYRSPAGAHMLSRAPVVAADTVRATVLLMRDVLRRIQAEKAQALHQKGIDL